MFVIMSRTNSDRTRECRDKLLKAGRALFGKLGYAATSTPMIATEAGVSRGAIYHHFKDKEALFKAVIEAEYQRLEEAIDRNTTNVSDPLEALIEGGDNYISAASDPVSQRILFIDGPVIVSGSELLSIDNQTTTNSLLQGIEVAQAAGRLPPDVSSGALASMMSGAYDRAVLDGFGVDDAERLSIRQAIRSLWFGLSKLA